MRLSRSSHCTRRVLCSRVSIRARGVAAREGRRRRRLVCQAGDALPPPPPASLYGHLFPSTTALRRPVARRDTQYARECCCRSARDLSLPARPAKAARGSEEEGAWVGVGSLQMRCPVFAVFPPRLLLGSPVVQLPASSGARHHGRGVELLLLFRFTEARRPAPWRRYNFNERTASDVEGATISGGAVLQTGLTPTGGKAQLFGSKQPRPASL